MKLKLREDFETSAQYIAYLEKQVYGYGEKYEVPASMEDLKRMAVERDNYLDYSRRHFRECVECMVMDGAGVILRLAHVIAMRLYNIFWGIIFAWRSL